MLPTKYIIEKDDGSLQIHKHMNKKLKNEIIGIKYFEVIKVIKFIYRFYMQILIQNNNHSI